MQPTKATRKTPRKPTSAKTKGNLKLVSSNRLDLPRPLLAIVDEHKYVSRLLPLLQAEAEKMADSEEADYECMEDIMHYMVNYPDRYHHPKEDLIFERMSGLSAETAKTVNTLREDHEKMAVQAEVLCEQISAFRNPKKAKKIDRAELAGEIKQYAISLRKHMALEESKVLQPASASLTEKDWDEIDKAIEPIIDPIFGDAISDRYVRLMQRYVNEFVSVTTSGKFPIHAVESGVGKIEQTIYTVLEIKDVIKSLIRNGGDSIKDKVSHFKALTGVRSKSDLKAWRKKSKTSKQANKEEWDVLVQELKDIVDSVGKPETNEHSHADVSTITLKTEKELLAYQEKPFEPEERPTTSWQAALMNVLMRATIKPMMMNVDIENLENDKRFQRKEKAFQYEGINIEPVTDNNFKAEWILPEGINSDSEVILYLPGGGFLAPASNMHRKMLSKIGTLTHRRILMVNYRLLPEHPFPAGLEDALAAYQYLLDQGVRPEQIILGGDSAGGNLAMSLMIALRDDKLPLPAACMLLSPLTDLTFSTAARSANRWKDPLLPSIRKGGTYFWYAGDHPVDHPLVSPIYGDYHEFPRIFALVSSTETLLDDTLVIARKARAQGVDFEVEVWHSLPHAWPIFSFLPEADAAVERLSEFIRSVPVSSRKAATGKRSRAN